MQIKESMTKQVITADSDSSLKEVAAKMEKCDVGCIPIVEGDRLVGIITDRDIIIRGVAKGLDLTMHQAKEIMSTNLCIATPDMDDSTAAELMISNKIRRLPVLDFDKLVGIVTLGDLAVTTGDTTQCGHILEEVSSPRGPKCLL